MKQNIVKLLISFWGLALLMYAHPFQAQAHRNDRIDSNQSQELDSLSFLKAVNNGALIIDTRNKAEFEKGFIPGSIQIQASPNFMNWFDLLVSAPSDLVFIGQNEFLASIFENLSKKQGFQVYGFSTKVYWPKEALKRSEILDLETFKTYLKRDDVQIIDLRTEAEYAAGHIEGVENIPLQGLKNQMSKVSKEKPVVIFCQSGVRAAMGYSLLESEGFENILNFSGGMNAWKSQ